MTETTGTKETADTTWTIETADTTETIETANPGTLTINSFVFDSVLIQLPTTITKGDITQQDDASGRPHNTNRCPRGLRHQ
jgi:hypothetical protein